MLAGPGSAVAASCNGKSHGPPVLASGAASPGAGTPATTITFSVQFTDAAGCAPTSIEVVIAGLGQFAMSGPGSGFDGGVTFVVSRTLPPGSWDYGFSATSGSGAGEETVFLTQTSPNRVTITAPTPPPTPAPTPKPTPKPTAPPTAPPTPAPTAPPTPTPTQRPTAPPTPGATPVPTTAPRPTPGATAGPAATPAGSVAPTGASPAPGSSTAPAGEPLGSASPSDGVIVGLGPAAGGFGGFGGPPAGPAGGGSGKPPVAPTRGFLSSLYHDARPGTIAVALISAATSVLAVGALGVAARRRRQEAVPDGAVVAQVDAAFLAAAAAAAAAPSVPSAMDGPPPWQTLTGRAPTRFDGAGTGGADRKTISYRFVRVSDGPDDLRSREIGRLDRGDEVEVVGEQDGMLLVKAANGLQGWVPRVVIVG